MALLDGTLHIGSKRGVRNVSIAEFAVALHDDESRAR